MAYADWQTAGYGSNTPPARDIAAGSLSMFQNPISMDPNSNSVGGRTGIAAYNGITLPNYKDPYDVAGFKGSKYYDIANGSSMSPWAKLASEQQGKLAAQNNAAAKANTQGVAAHTATSLAQQGGLTSGARERSQEQAGKNLLSMVQNNNQEAGNNTANIGIEDAKQREQMLADATGKLTSMTAGNIQGQNAYNQNTTGMLNQAVGANETSKAQVAAANASNNSPLMIAAIMMAGTLSAHESKAISLMANSTAYSKTRAARKLIGSEGGLRGYYSISKYLSPAMRSETVSKVVFHTMVKPLAKKGLLAKIWGQVFALVGKVV